MRERVHRAEQRGRRSTGFVRYDEALINGIVTIHDGTIDTQQDRKTPDDMLQTGSDVAPGCQSLEFVEEGIDRICHGRREY